MKVQQIVLIIALSSMHTVAAADEHGRSQLPAEVQQCLEWLPTDTETLVVANGPFEIGWASDGGATAFRSLPLHIFKAVSRGALATSLEGQKVHFAIEGSRNFRSPADVGMMPYDGCHILRFDEAVGPVLESAFQSLFDNGAKMLNIGGHPIATFQIKRPRSESDLYVALPDATLLLCATSRVYLAEVLARMKHAGAEQAFPENLVEWKHVRAKSSVWAIRHYRNGVAADDRSSPLNAHSVEQDLSAIGFVFWWDATTPASANARYLTKNRLGADIVTRAWDPPMSGLSPTIRQVEPGVIEMSIVFTDETRTAASLIFLGYLGHGIYL